MKSSILTIKKEKIINLFHKKRDVMGRGQLGLDTPRP